MTVLTIDCRNPSGRIKRLNCVNNGPTAPGVRQSPSSFEAYKAAEIPYARNHDASFFAISMQRIVKLFKSEARVQRCNASAQNTVHVRDGNAVIYDRHIF